MTNTIPVTDKKPTPYRLEQAAKLLVALNHQQCSATRSAAMVASDTLLTDATDVSSWVACARQLRLISDNVRGPYLWLNDNNPYDVKLVTALAQARAALQRQRTAVVWERRQKRMLAAKTAQAQTPAVTMPNQQPNPSPIVTTAEPQVQAMTETIVLPPPLPQPVTDAFLAAFRGLVAAVATTPPDKAEPEPAPDLAQFREGLDLYQVYVQAVISNVVATAAADLACVKQDCANMQRAFSALVDLIATDMPIAARQKAQVIVAKTAPVPVPPPPPGLRLLIVGLKGDQEQSVMDKVNAAGLSHKLILHFIPVTEKTRTVYPVSDAVIICPKWMNHKIYYQIKDLGLPYVMASGVSSVVGFVTDTTWIQKSKHN